MSWTLHVRAVHADQGLSFEQVIEACPALVGRDASLCLPNDEGVSKVHASIDVRDGRIYVRDARSTNGTFLGERALEPHCWVDVGSADDEVSLRLSGWALSLRARRRAPRPMVGMRPAPTTASATVVEAVPFGASQSSEGGVTEGAGFLVSHAAPMTRLADRARAVRVAIDEFRRAVGDELEGVDPRHRGDLARSLRQQYAEIREDSVLDARVSGLVPRNEEAPTAAARALAAVQELSARYVDDRGPVATAEDVDAFAERLRLGLDALLEGVVRLVNGVDSYQGQMAVASNEVTYPRDPRSFARAVFEWRSSFADDGARVARNAILDVIVQQVGSFQATCRGVNELLRELAPETIEAKWQSQIQEQGFWRGTMSRFLRPLGLLRAYRTQHDDLSSEEASWFRVLFGGRFVAEYRAFARETRAAADVHVRRIERAERPELPIAMGRERTNAQAEVGASVGPPARQTGSGTVVMAPALKSKKDK